MNRTHKSMTLWAVLSTMAFAGIANAQTTPSTSQTGSYGDTAYQNNDMNRDTLGMGYSGSSPTGSSAPPENTEYPSGAYPAESRGTGSAAGWLGLLGLFGLFGLRHRREHHVSEMRPQSRPATT